MKFTETELPGVILVEPTVHRDHRGFFLETYHRDKYAEGGIDVEFVQDNHSRSGAGIVRGLHAQLRRPQGKLVRAVEGSIFDVAVDIRHGSPTFGRWTGRRLSADNFHQLWVPPGFAHGFAVLSGQAQVEYKCTEIYLQDDEIALRWDDPDIGIEWPLPAGVEPVISAKDEAAHRLVDVTERLPVYPDPAVR
jgi:dTDP-4-dehydrorhamnose 3,5-epimerase